MSGLPPGGGTENNERLHRYLKRRFLRGASVISPELAGAILAVIFYVYNARLSVKSDCHRKGFKVERLLAFHDTGCQNITDYNPQRTLSRFNLLLDPQ